jgi:hypothetical protein
MEMGNSRNFKSQESFSSPFSFKQVHFHFSAHNLLVDALPSVNQPTYDIILVLIVISIFLLPPLRFYLEWSDQYSPNTPRRSEHSLFVKYFTNRLSKVGIEHQKLDNILENSSRSPT